MEWLTTSQGKKIKAGRFHCKQCGIEFVKSLYETKRSSEHFCSRICNAKSKTNKETVSCRTCKSEFYRTPSRIKHGKSNVQFCSRTCKDLAQRIDSGVDELRPSQYKNGKTNYRAVAYRNKEKRCEKCGFANELALCIHHIDKNRDNNCISNLQVLCYNCHMIIHHSGIA